MPNQSRTLTLLPPVDESALSAAATGDAAALRVLLGRYSSTSWRLAHAVTGHEDAATASVVAGVRQALAERARTTDELTITPAGLLLGNVRQAALRQLGRRGDPPVPDVVAEAYRSLPECWRSVLLLTRAEGFSVVDAAAVLALPPDDTAQLVTRATAGFGERYLQLMGPRAQGSCRGAVARLEAYLHGELAPRDVALLDQHLAGCPACHGRAEWFNHVGAEVDRVVPGSPTGLVAHVADALATAPLASGGRTWFAAKVLTVAAAVLLALGLIGPGSGGDAGERPPGTVDMTAARLSPERGIRADEVVSLPADEPVTFVAVVARQPSVRATAPRADVAAPAFAASSAWQNDPVDHRAVPAPGPASAPPAPSIETPPAAAGRASTPPAPAPTPPEPVASAEIVAGPVTVGVVLHDDGDVEVDAGPSIAQDEVLSVTQEA